MKARFARCEHGALLVEPCDDCGPIAAFTAPATSPSTEHDDPRHIYHTVFNPSGCDKFYCLKRFDPSTPVVIEEAAKEIIDFINTEAAGELSAPFGQQGIRKAAKIISRHLQPAAIGDKKDAE